MTEQTKPTPGQPTKAAIPLDAAKILGGLADNAQAVAAGSKQVGMKMTRTP